MTQAFNASMNCTGFSLLEDESDLYKTTCNDRSYTIYATTKFKRNEIVRITQNVRILPPIAGGAGISKMRLYYSPITQVDQDLLPSLIPGKSAPEKSQLE